MKNFATFFTIAVILISCGSDSGSSKISDAEYLINGTITGAGGQPIYLDLLSFSGNTPVDTAIIANDGSFTMLGNIEEKALYLIRINASKNWLVVLEPGKVDFKADFNDIYSYEIQGSDEAKACANFIIQAGQNQKELNELNQRFNQARASGDIPTLVNVQQQYQQKFQQSQAFITTFIDTTSHTLVGLFAANLLQVDQYTDYLNKYLAKAEQDMPNSKYVADLKAKVQSFQQQQERQQKANAQLAVGKEAPDFELKSPKGKTLPLSAMRGKVVLVDFWASWCRPCRVENPHLVKMYEKYKKKGFDVYSVSLDKTMDRWVKAIEADKLTWKNHGSNLKGWQCPVAQMYKVSSIPNTYLLDEEGKIIAKNLRGATLENKLVEIFGS